MELIGIILFFVLLATIIMPWVNHARIRSMREDIRHLRSRISLLEGSVNPAPETWDREIPQKESFLQQPDKLQDRPVFKASDEDIEEWQEQVALRASPPEPVLGQKQITAESFEHNLAAKLPVWVGAISLICAAFFLVKYSIDMNLVSPAVRVCLGGLFGASLLCGGQWIGQRDFIANSVRIAQGLVGAGVVVLYVSIYAAINLYDLLPSGIGFIGMASVTGLAVILSLRHGQVIAVFGLVGGLITPALVGSTDPNSAALFTYLFLFFSGMFAVMIRKGWWNLAIMSVLGVFGWSGFWFLSIFNSQSDPLVLVLFAVGVAAVVLVTTGKQIAQDPAGTRKNHSLHGLNLVAIAGGFSTILWLGIKIELSLFDWSMMGLISAAVMTLAYFQPAFYQRVALAKLLGSLTLFYLWATQVPLADAIIVALGFSVIYVGGAGILMRKVSDPRYWAGIQVIAGLSLYIICWYTLDLPEWFSQPFSMFWGILGLILASLSIYQAADIQKKFVASQSIRDQLVATYAMAASAFISIGMSIELPWEYVPLSLAFQIAATAWIYQISEINFLKTIMLVLMAVFMAMNLDHMLFFSETIIRSIDGRAASMSSLRELSLDAPLVKLGIPSMLMFFSIWLCFKQVKEDKIFIHSMFGSALVLAMASGYYLIRYIVHGDYVTGLSTEAGFIERGVITLLIMGLGFGLLKFLEIVHLQFLRPWAYGVLALSGLRYILFDLMIDNPYFSGDQFVGDMPLMNGITLTYGSAALVSLWALLNKDFSVQKIIFQVIAFISLFAFVTLSVTQYFHGENLAYQSIVPEEMYGYSVVWLFTGLGLLTAGIQKNSKSLRMASLAFMLLTITKVFLFDAAELEGLYRVFSFLGLGISLMGLSFFYSRFVFSAHNR
jgi:uncharacterized membrane protein